MSDPVIRVLAATGVAVGAAARLGGADGDHLRREVPVADGRCGVEPLVALKPDQPAAERRRDRLGDLGLADAGLSLQKERAPEPERQEDDGRQGAVADIVLARQQAFDVVYGFGCA